MCDSDHVMVESVKICDSYSVNKKIVKFGALVMAQSESPVVDAGTDDTLDMVDTRTHGMVTPRAAVVDKGALDPVGLEDDQVELVSVDVTPGRVAPLRNVVRQPILRYAVPHSIIIIGVQWPCWLGPCLSLWLPIAGAFFPQSLHQFFDVPNWSQPRMMSTWATYS